MLRVQVSGECRFRAWVRVSSFLFVGHGLCVCGGVCAVVFRPECGLVGVVLGVWVWVAGHMML